MENGSNGAMGEELENGGVFWKYIVLRYMSALEIYVCTAHFENRDPCTMGTWVNSF